MIDPVLMLDASCEEEAAWMQAGELEHELAVVHLRRAESLARGYCLAAAAGRADLAVADVMGTLRMGKLTAEGELAKSLFLVARPRLVERLEDGRIGWAHADALLGVLLPLEDAVADQVEAHVLDRIGLHTRSQVLQMARRAELRLDPKGCAERRKQARQDRRMSISDAGNGMAWVSLLVRAEQALAIGHRAEQQTRADDDSGRTRDQRRLDWAVDTLLADSPATAATEAGAAHAGAEAAAPPEHGAAPKPGAAPQDDAAPEAGAEPQADAGSALARLDGRRRRPVQALVTVPVSTALGLTDEPCELLEHGPIGAEHGRELLTDAELRKVCVDALTGEVLYVQDQVVRPVASRQRVADLGGGDAAWAQAQAEAVRQAVLDMVLGTSVMPVDAEDTYRPSTGLSRTVKTRHPRCDFPCCSTPSRACDDEHTRPHPRGQTSAENLRPRSRWCHQSKQRGWTPTPSPDGGTQWQSPSGRSYLSPAQHEPPPPLPPDAVLHPPRPPERDDHGPPAGAGPTGEWPDDPPLPEPPPPEPPERADKRFPDEPPF